MRISFALTFLPVFWATGVAAGDHNSCDHAHSDNDCTPVYACIGEQGEWFKGQALGQTKGSLTGILASGANCLGKWSSHGAGKFDLTCTNGTYMQVYYTTSDPVTKTTIGQGISMDGRFVQGWSGKNVQSYFSDPESSQTGTLHCGSSEVPLG